MKETARKEGGQPWASDVVNENKKIIEEKLQSEPEFMLNQMAGSKRDSEGDIQEHFKL